MTIKFNNVYLNETTTVAGKEEKKGSFKDLYDKTYDDYYMGCKTFEQAEIKMLQDAININLNKSKKRLNEIDIVLGSDLINQNVINSYALANLNLPYLGVYNACASLCEEIIIASSLLQNKDIKNIMCNVSSHNLTAERQYRNPIEYGAPKPLRSTYTCTGAVSLIVSNKKSNIKITSGTIGTVCDLDVKDPFDMGKVMAPACAKTIYEHLIDLNKTINDYDIILTGDLGVYGKDILIKYMKELYKIDISTKIIDAASIIYNRNNQKRVKAGGSGPACIGLVTFTYILDLIKKKKIKRVLLVATGALMNSTMNNQKLSMPSIAHAISLEVID